jgi:hypothetical protein
MSYSGKHSDINHQLHVEGCGSHHFLDSRQPSLDPNTRILYLFYKHIEGWVSLRQSSCFY